MMGPLRGLKIIEVAGIGAAPYGCMMLADMGAEVIRVERSRTPADATRPVDPQLRNRRSIAVDLKHARGIEVLLRLCDTADVLVEPFRPGVAERLGFGPEVCRARNPRLIYGRMTGWGQQGPLARTAGHDINYISLTGLLHQIGERGDRPLPPMNIAGDLGGGGLLLAFGVLCACFERERSGVGQVVDAAMIDGALSFMSGFIGMRAVGSWLDETGGDVLTGASHYYGTYRTKDGHHVAVGSVEPQFHALLVEKLGLDAMEFGAGVGFDGACYARLSREVWPRLKKRLAAAIALRTRAELMGLFEGSDACVTPVLKMDEAPQHPHNVARGAFVNVGGLTQNAPAPRFSRTPAAMPIPPRSAGEDTEEILRSAGYSTPEILALKTAGAVSHAQPSD